VAGQPRGCAESDQRKFLARLLPQDTFLVLCLAKEQGRLYRRDIHSDTDKNGETTPGCFLPSNLSKVVQSPGKK
jgi:hypothetical protein